MHKAASSEIYMTQETSGGLEIAEMEPSLWGTIMSSQC